MSSRLMILPCKVFEHIRLVSVPDDFEDHEVYRAITGIIARVQEEDGECTWEELAEVLEDQGFIPVDCLLGPELRC